MTGEWRKVKLGEVVSINPDTIGADWRYPYIKYIDISSVGEGTIVEPPRILRLDEMPSRARRLVQEGDTVLSTVRPGRRAMFFVKHPEPEWVVSTGFAVLRPKREYIEPRYLYACVFDKEFTDFLVQREKGAAYPAVLPEDIADAVISLPPLAEQRAIAHILGALDDKIELNRRMSETLEAIAHALFKAWFVDFEPVRAKLEGRWRRGQSLPGLPAYLYDHFPDRLVESELGEIPEGWEVVELGRLISFEKGKKPTTTFPTPCEGCLPVILMETFDGSTAYYAMSEKMVIAQAHDVLMVMDGASSGRVETGYHGVVGSTIAKIVPSEGSRIGHRFVYYALKTLEPEIGEHLTGTSIPHADKGWIAHQKVCLPKNGKLLAVFEEIAGQKRKRIEALRAESRTLAALRDALLPKLIRGEIRVKDAERFLEGKGYEVRPREASPSQYAPERV
jgi:type I restriction enzyme S subunit